MRQLGFLIDLSKCISCHACEMACKVGRHLDPSENFRRVVEVEPTDEDDPFYFYSISCNHCLDPECIRVCPQNSYYKRKDGIVIHNPDKCEGCYRCVRFCPFQAPQFDPRTGRVDKCDFCIDLLLQKEEPYCVAACPQGAIVVGELDDFKKYASEFPGFSFSQKTRPSIRFRF